MKNLLREYTFFLVPQKNIYTNNWKTYPVSKNHFIAVGGFIFSYRQTNGKCSCVSLRLPLPRTDSHCQIIICRSIGYVQVMCTEVYTKGSAIIELLELWEHICVRVCVYVCVMCVCMCVHVCVCVQRKEKTYIRSIKQMLPSTKDRKQGPLPRPLDFFRLYCNIPWGYLHTVTKYNSLLATVKLTNQTSLFVYWHQLIKMTIDSYYNKNKYV